VIGITFPPRSKLYRAQAVPISSADGTTGPGTANAGNDIAESTRTVHYTGRRSFVQLRPSLPPVGLGSIFAWFAMNRVVVR
jgi:hypothetical protein